MYLCYDRKNNVKIAYNYYFIAQVYSLIDTNEL